MILLHHARVALRFLLLVPNLVTSIKHPAHGKQVQRAEEVDDADGDLGGEITRGVSSLEGLGGDDVADCIRDCSEAC